MPWIGAAISVGGGLLMSQLGGDAPTQSSSTSSELPSWLSGPASDVAGRVRGMLNQGRTGDQLVAGLGPDELQAMGLARTAPETGDIETARGVLGGIPRSFSGFDLSGYMNPYIQGVLHPAARDLTIAHLKTIADLQRKAPMRAAFGGSRQTMLEGDANKNYMQSLEDLYGKGYASAFESGANRFENDRSSNRALAGNYLDVARAASGQRSDWIRTLLTTGALDRSVRQGRIDAPLDFLGRAGGVLGGLPHSQSQTSTSVGARPDRWTQGLGTALGTYGFGKDQGWWGGGNGGGGNSYYNDPAYQAAMWSKP